MRNKVKSVIALLFVISLTSIFQFNAYAEESANTNGNNLNERADNYQGVAYNSVTVEQLGRLSNISVDKIIDSISIHFNLNQKDYNIKADYLEDSDIQQKYYSYNSVTGESIDIMVNDENITGTITLKKESPVK